MDYTIFNMLTNVNACDYTRGCTEFALKVDSGRKVPCRTGESNLHQWQTGLMVQLSYIPTHYTNYILTQYVNYADSVIMSTDMRSKNRDQL